MRTVITINRGMIESIKADGKLDALIIDLDADGCTSLEEAGFQPVEVQQDFARAGQPTAGIIDAPALDRDAEVLAKYGRQISPQGRLERRIVANLIAHLLASGFELHSVFDGEEETRVRDMKAAMELIFDLDEASLRFNQPGTPNNDHGVLLIMGNGIDIISDWNYTEGDPDGFSAAMDAFDAETYS